MSYSELKAKLAEMGLPTTGNTAALQARYDEAVAAATAGSNPDDAAASPSDDAAAEKVVVNGIELTPLTPDAQGLREFVASRRMREFPQLIQAIPDGNYHTTGRFSLYPWTSIDREGREVSVTLLVVEIANDENAYFVGEWEFVSRTYGFTPVNGEVINPHWVLNTFATGSLRSQQVLAMPENTNVVKHSGIGRLTDKPGTRNYLCHWIAQD